MENLNVRHGAFIPHVLPQISAEQHDSAYLLCNGKIDAAGRPEDRKKRMTITLFQLRMINDDRDHDDRFLMIKAVQSLYNDENGKVSKSKPPHSSGAPEPPVQRHRRSGSSKARQGNTCGIFGDSHHGS